MRWITRDRSFYRMLILLAIPVAMQNLITFVVNFADNLMVSSLGDAAVSGVYMGNQIQTFLQLFSSGIGGAIQILGAQYWGKKDKTSVKLLVSIGFRFSVGIGFAVTLLCLLLPERIISVFTNEPEVIAFGAEYLRVVCLSYAFFCVTQLLIAAMRCIEAARIGMVVSSISLIVNVGLNYCLIYGKCGFPEMGVAGAALATVLSRVVETAVMAFYVFFIDRRLRLRPRDFLAGNRTLLRDFVRYGAPLTGGEIVWCVNMMSQSVILGHFENAAGIVTAASVANTMHTLAYVLVSGMAAAVGIITSKTVGAGKIETMKEYARTVQILFLFFGFLTSGMIALLKTPFIGLYGGITAEAAAYSMQFINVLSVTIIGTCYQAAGLFGLVKSGGDIGFVFKNDTIFVFLVVIPSSVIAMALGAPAWVVFACMKCDQILKCFVAVAKINRFNWMKNLTRDHRELKESMS